MWRKIFVAALLCASLGIAQEKTGETKPGLPTQPEMEKKFKDLLTGCVFSGRWCLVKDGTLGEEKREKYTIQGANKTGGDNWIIYARIQYGEKDITVPVPVQVKWAGDTPVITLSDVTIPNLGTYSARVLVHKDSYAGTWSAGDHGGILYGLIEKQR